MVPYSNSQANARAEVAGLVRGACSLSNPFCPAAWGARWPDNSMTRSVGWSAKYLQSLSTDVNGNLARLYLPALFNPVVPATFPIASPGSVTAFPTRANVISIPTGIVRWRITSWGLKLSCPSAKLSTQGTVFVRLFSPMLFEALAEADVSTYKADAFYEVPLCKLIDEDMFIVPMPLGDSARLFRDQTFSEASAMGLTNQLNPGWQCITVAVYGAQTTNILNVTAYYNYELVFGDGEATMEFAKAPPQSNPMITDSTPSILDRVGNFVEGTAERVDNLFKSKALKYFSAAAGYLAGGPRGAVVGFQGTQMIQDVD